MGVDYDSEVGIGFEIDIDRELVEEKYDGCQYTFLDDLLQDSPYSYLIWGNSFSSELRCGIVLSDPFKSGYDLTDRMIDLDGFVVTTNGVEKLGEFGIVGGLHVW